MKIKTKELIAFLKKVNMSGTHRIADVLLKFDSDGIRAKAITKAQEIAVEAYLGAEAFTDYKAIGYIGIGNIETVIKLVERFGEEIELFHQKNTIKVVDSSNTKSVTWTLFDEGLFDKGFKLPVLKYDNSFIVSTSTLHSIFKDVLINKNCEIIMKTKDGAVIFTNTGEYVFETTVEAPAVKEGVVVRFGSALIDATNNLDGMLEIGIKTDFPANVIEKKDSSNVSVIISPFVESEKEN
jgi:hypothetical protein